jgi:hypothetical protein
MTRKKKGSFGLCASWFQGKHVETCAQWATEDSYAARSRRNFVMVSSSSVAISISSYPPPPLPPPPPPPPSVYRAIAARPLAEQILEVKSLVCKRRPQRMEARLHFRGVHRELLDRVENGQWRRNSTGASKWSCHAPHEKPNSRVTPEVKQALLNIAKLEPPRDHQGIHICEITQVKNFSAFAKLLVIFGYLRHI